MNHTKGHCIFQANAKCTLQADVELLYLDVTKPAKARGSHFGVAYPQTGGLLISGAYQ